MSSYNKFNCTVADVTNKVHNLGSDTLKVLLTNTVPNAADTVYDDASTHTLKSTSNAAESTAGSGYSAGGTAVGSNANSQSGGTDKLTGNAVTFTSTGTIGPFRYAVLYNASAGTSGNRPLLGWWDYGSSVTLSSGETITVGKDTAGDNWDSSTPIQTWA
jgi:hypothetical protein